jgi:uncharacterized ferredoxin-like protein
MAQLSHKEGFIMIYTDKHMEEEALLGTAARMCAAARTAPKARGLDQVLTLVLTGSDKDALADQMDLAAVREFGDKPNSIARDAANLRASQAVVLIGVRKAFAGLKFCSFCGFANCAACEKAGGRCAFNTIDLGIAIGSAVSVAADERVDNRIMYSIGKVAAEMGYSEPDVIWHGIPLSIRGKNIFFDRK